MAKKSNNIIGVTGEYLVCAELGKQNILALVTPKNNPLFDIVAVSPDAQKIVTLQVKTMSEGNKQGWKLSKDICNRRNNPALYTVLVNLKGETNDFYIFEYDTLSEKVEQFYGEYISKPKRNGEAKKDIDFRWYDLKSFTPEDHARKNNWGLLGF